MAINTKNKRKLIYQNKTYYWYVAPEYDEMYLTGKMLRLHIIAADSTWHGCFPLDSCLRTEERYAIHKAPVPVPDAVTPETVRQIIAHYLSENESRSK